MTAENDAAVTVFEASSHAVVATIAIPASQGALMPPRPMGAVLSPDGRYVYVSNGRARSVAVIDTQARRVSRMFEDLGMRPWGIAVSDDGRTVYTANGPSGDLSIIDVETGKSRRVQIGGSPWGVAIGRQQTRETR